MTGSSAVELAPGLRYIPDYLDRRRQEQLLGDLGDLLRAAPLFQPTMPKSGAPFSVRMTNCGALGWISDQTGYRYSDVHPVTGRPWPPMPSLVTNAWADLADYPRPPEACLVNYYAGGTKMGLHQDKDEDGFAAPVVSLSLGDSCLFRFGGLQRRAPTRSIKLHSGDALVLGGPARLVFHGIDRILAGSSTLIEGGGRFNLTIRRVSGEPVDDNAP